MTQSHTSGISQEAMKSAEHTPRFNIGSRLAIAGSIDTVSSFDLFPDLTENGFVNKVEEAGRRLHSFGKATLDIIGGKVESLVSTAQEKARAIQASRLGKRVTVAAVSLSLLTGSVEGVTGSEQDAYAKGLSAKSALVEETPENKEACFKAAFEPNPYNSFNGKFGYYHKPNGKRSKKTWLSWRNQLPLLEEANTDTTCPGTMTLTFRARERNPKKGAKRKWIPNSKVYKIVTDTLNAPPSTTIGYYSGKQKIVTFRKFDKKKKPEVLVTQTYKAFGDSRSERHRVNSGGVIGSLPKGFRPIL